MKGLLENTVLLARGDDGFELIEILIFVIVAAVYALGAFLKSRSAKSEQEGEQQRRQLYEDVKRGVEAKMRHAMQQQLGGAAPGRINVESQPLFQEELRRALGQLDLQYMKLLDEYKQELLAVS